MAAIGRAAHRLVSSGFKGISFTAVRLSNLGARLAYATVEGLAFAFGRRGGTVILSAELLVLSYHAGPRRALNTALGALIACALGRALWVLGHNFWHHPDIETLPDIWDWEPKGDAYQSSAWHVLRTLVRTADRVRKENPRLDQILSLDTLQPAELALRLYYLYTQEEDSPAPYSFQQAALASWDSAASLDVTNSPSSTKARGGGDGCGTADVERLPPGAATSGATASAVSDAASPSAAGDGREDGGSQGVAALERSSSSVLLKESAKADEEDCQEVEPVPDELMEQLEYYRPLTCLLYECWDDEALSRELAKEGYALAFASYESDLTSGSPSFYLSVHEEKKEVLLSVRGTFSPEDVFTDLLAAGALLKGTSYYCHTGMCKGAMVLSSRVSDLLAAAEAQGFTITLVGHSLGAGVVAILACTLKDRGLKKLRCYAYETPACMGKDLAESCADIVVSTCIGDDIVPRMCPEIFARFLEQLGNFDYKEEAEKRGGLPMALSVIQHLSQLFSNDKANDGNGNNGGGGDTQTTAMLQDAAEAVRDTAPQKACEKQVLPQEGEGADDCTQYDPYMPGRVVFIYRLPTESSPDEEAGKEEGSADGGGNGAAGSDRPGDGHEAGASRHRALQKAASVAPAGEKEIALVAEELEKSTVSVPVQPAGRVLLRPCHSVLRNIRLTEYMLTDHFIDSAFAIAALSVTQLAGALDS